MHLVAAFAFRKTLPLRMKNQNCRLSLPPKPESPKKKQLQLKEPKRKEERKSPKKIQLTKQKEVMILVIL